MAARSVFVNFSNKADLALVRSGDSLSHGIWTNRPPDRIEAGSTVSWESESSGVLTGTEGEVNYNVETGPGQTGGSTHFHWDNPYVGSNSFDESGPSGYKLDRTGGDGDNATVNWTFSCASATCDGIPDDWKINGTTVDPGDGSGPQFINLPAMGATVNKPDIFIQLDWMADGTHSHALSAAAIKTVVTAFANAPYKSPTGSIGINLHVDAGPNSIMNFATNQTWGALSRARQLTEVTNLGTGGINNYSWVAFDAIKNAFGGFKSTGRIAIFHYAISAHGISTLGNSGISRTIPGSDFIISLASCCGVTPTDSQQAGTFMHELGHNLGLQHGGGDGVNNKPNYISIMNYLFQFGGLTRAGVANIIDYSNVALNALDETNLDETTGVGPAAAGVATSHWAPPAGGNPGAFVTVADGSKPIDWNVDGLTTGKNVSFDVNNDGTNATLTPFDDWKNLKLKGGSIGAGGDFQQPMETPVNEITPEEMKLVMPADTTPPVTVATITPPPNAAGWNRKDVALILVATDDISGVARTESALDGAPTIAGTGPIPVTTEGVHTLRFHSIDRSQNVEAWKQAVVRLDKTAPEAVITYDPYTHQIVVHGRDLLSGVDPGPVSPGWSVTPTTWTDFGSDTAELRTYRIQDHADNTLLLTMKVKCEPDELEFNIIALQYNDEKELRRPERNTITFERVIGRGLNHPLLTVEQEVSFGEGDMRRTVEASYDVLSDELEIEYFSGDWKCGEGGGTNEGTPMVDGNGAEGGGGKGDNAGKDPEVRGLILLRVVTDKGRLLLEQ